MHIKTRTNKGKKEIKAAVIAHLQQIGEPIMDHEPPSALGPCYAWRRVIRDSGGDLVDMKSIAPHLKGLNANFR